MAVHTYLAYIREYPPPGGRGATLFACLDSLVQESCEDG